MVHHIGAPSAHLAIQHNKKRDSRFGLQSTVDCSTAVIYLFHFYKLLMLIVISSRDYQWVERDAFIIKSTSFLYFPYPISL